MAKSKSTLMFPDRRISDTFLQFAEPLLNAFGPNATEAQMEQPLMIAWTVWNAVVYADVGANKQMLEKVRGSMGHDPQLKGFVEFLIDRKRMMFGDDLASTSCSARTAKFGFEPRLAIRHPTRERVDTMPKKKAS